MNSMNSGGFFTGLVKMIVAIVVLGVGVGAVVSNLPGQLAEADRIRAETDWQSRVREQVELPNLVAERELERRQNQALLEAQMARQAEELRLERLRNDQRLRTEEMLQYAFIFLLLLLFSSMAVVLTVTLSRVGWNLVSSGPPPPPPPGSAPATAWHDPVWRRLRREEARQQERLQRQSGQSLAVQPANGANGHH